MKPSKHEPEGRAVSREEVARRIADHRAQLRRLGVSRLALFGSIARGEPAKRSDVDVLVEFARPIGLFAFLEVQHYLETLLGRRVDLVTPDALRPQMRDAVLAEALRAL